jgi:NADPH-dependent 2,4-dienoyl-CoA reductase/sulfur reductase-like enzyme/rhodanese-related sulfurtransferase
VASKRIVIIGGVACGPKAAARARRCDPHAVITLIEEGNLVSYASCGLPYYVGGVIQRRSALLVRTPQDFKSISDIDVMTGTHVDRIDRGSHQVHITSVASGSKTVLPYDKLVLATGANPVRPPLEGRQLGGVFSVKDVSDADAILAWVTPLQNGKAVVIGAGLIGVEMADVLTTRGLSTTLVEGLGSVLPGMLDEDISGPLAKYIEKKGVDIRLAQRVLRFEGENGKVKRVITEKGPVEADIVVMAIGVRPNVILAKEAGLALGPTGAILVNAELQTNDPDIYAGGDCVENKNIITGLGVFVPLGSTANKHGRIIGSNVAGGHETFPGVLGTGMVKVFDFNVGRTGLGEQEAKAKGYDVVTSLVAGSDRAGYFPGSKDILLKVIVERKTGRVLGGQGTGKGDVAKRIDVLATAITFGATVEGLAALDLAYAPQYNSAMDILHAAANTIRNKMAGMADSITAAEVKARLDKGEDIEIVDVRTQREWDAWRIDSPRVRWIPQNQLYAKLADLPKDKQIIVTCRGGTRAYQSARLLKGAGFEKVRYLEGSVTGWPYGTIGQDKE